MKKTYILIIICLIVLSYFGTKLVTNLNDYTIQKSVEISKKNNAPTIEVITNEVTITQNSQLDYSELLVSAEDSEDGNIIGKVTHNDIDTSKAGTQNLVYTVTDSDGNTASKTIKVTVESVENTDSINDEVGRIDQ